MKMLLESYLSISVYTAAERNAAKVIVLNGVYLLALIPVLIHLPVLQIMTTLLFFIAFSIAALYAGLYLRSVKLAEIIYIIIFASYLSGNPVIHLF